MTDHHPNLAARAEADPCCRRLLDALARGPQTWTQLSEAGLTSGDVLAAIGRLTQAGTAAFRVGPLLVERVDVEEVPTP